MTVPYTYCVTHKPSNRRYYGVRTKRDCHPDDLWTTYFTSSKEIKRLIEEDGKDSFEVTVRKIFEDRLTAQEWEIKVLQRLKVTTNSKWINKSISGWKWKTGLSTSGMSGKAHSEETKQRMRESRLTKIANDPDFAKQLIQHGRNNLHSPSAISKRSAKLQGQRRTNEQRERIRQGAIKRIKEFGRPPCSEETKAKIRETRLRTNALKREMQNAGVR